MSTTKIYSGPMSGHPTADGGWSGPATPELVENGIRYFQGASSCQTNSLTGEPAVPAAWYWEPEDYEGGAGLWSEPYATITAAQSAAEQWIADETETVAAHAAYDEAVQLYR